MGGSAGGGNNAQLFDLMAKYGGDSAEERTPQQMMHGGKHALQAEFSRQLGMGANSNGLTMNYPALFAAFDRGYAGGGMGMGGGNGGGGTSTATPTTPPVANPGQSQWQFPEYTQTWAFTPPPPTPYVPPQAFDIKKYGNPLPKKGVKKNV